MPFRVIFHFLFSNIDNMIFFFIRNFVLSWCTMARQVFFIFISYACSPTLESLCFDYGNFKYRNAEVGDIFNNFINLIDSLSKLSVENLFSLLTTVLIFNFRPWTHLGLLATIYKLRLYKLYSVHSSIFRASFNVFFNA